MFDKKGIVPGSLIYLVPATLPKRFSCQDVTDQCTLAGCADSLLLICSDRSASPLLGSKHRLSCADNSGVLARGAVCTNVHLAQHIAGVTRVGVDVHDISFASRSANVLGYEL